MPPLDPEKFGLLLSETSRAWRNELDRRLRPQGLSQGKWITLLHLANGADSLTQKEIAARIGIEEPTLAGLLNRLQHDGWIRRECAPSDRRCKTVHLEERSNALLKKILSTAKGLRHELLNEIPARDLQTCMKVLASIRDKAETISSPSLIRNGARHRNGRKP